MTSQHSSQFDQDNANDEPQLAQGVAKSESLLAEADTTECKNKHSLLVQLCRKLLEDECDQLSVNNLIKVVEQQRVSKSFLMELFETIKNIEKDHILQETLIVVMQFQFDMAEAAACSTNVEIVRADLDDDSELNKKLSVRAARFQLDTVINQINILAEKKHRHMNGSTDNDKNN